MSAIALVLASFVLGYFTPAIVRRICRRRPGWMVRQFERDWERNRAKREKGGGQ